MRPQALKIRWQEKLKVWGIVCEINQITKDWGNDFLIGDTLFSGCETSFLYFLKMRNCMLVSIKGRLHTCVTSSDNRQFFLWSGRFDELVENIFHAYLGIYGAHGDPQVLKAGDMAFVAAQTGANIVHPAL